MVGRHFLRPDIFLWIGRKVAANAPPTSVRFKCESAVACIVGNMVYGLLYTGRSPAAIYLCRLAPPAICPFFDGGVLGGDDVMIEQSTIVVPICPICEQPMSVTTPVLGFLPPSKSRTFECKSCPVMQTIGEMPFADSRRILH
jgi:hypothetical protein